jgi:hypothetical protein
MDSVRLASFRVERRSVAVAIFQGGQLDYTQTRQLPSDGARVNSSLVGFVNWVLDSFRIDSAALERIDLAADTQRAELTQLTIALLREAAIPITEVTKAELFEACGAPPLVSRRELRACATAIWPILNDSRSSAGVLDAAALGIYIETERLFYQ